jgi:hypothetical protein
MSKLGVYDRGGSLAPEDLQNVADAYEGIYNQLFDEGIVTWALADTDIPNRFQLSLTSLITAEIAAFYHVTPPPEGWTKYKMVALATIRRQLATSQDPEPVTAEYY